jgi:hypothetical protein
MLSIFNWFINLFKNRQLDPVLHFFNKSKLFYKTKNIRNDKCGKSYCGYKRIAHLTMLVSSEDIGLRMFLRIYRSPKKPHAYIFIWSFGDKKVTDFLFNGVHNSVPFKQEEMYKAIDFLINSMEAVKLMYSLRSKTAAKKINSIQSTKEV